MKQSIWRPIIFGAIFGALVFFMPFILIHLFIFFLVMGLFFRIMSRRWMGGPGMGGWAFADKIRNMSEEEYSAFKDRVRNRQYGCRHYYGEQKPHEGPFNEPAGQA